tara:strand:- start:1340 stop:1474 length:135 start_codon:yes stop_codon:yes gene_type:complete
LGTKKHSAKKGKHKMPDPKVYGPPEGMDLEPKLYGLKILIGREF